MRLVHRYADGDAGGSTYRVEDAPEPAWAICPQAFAERVCTSSDPDVRKDQVKWVEAALAASGHLISGTDGRPTRNMRLPDGTRARVYVLVGVANGAPGLTLLARALRGEARCRRDDVQPYSHGEGGRVVVSRPRIRPWDYQMVLDRPVAEGVRWYQAVLERHDA